MTDVFLYNTTDGAEIDQDVALTEGLESAFYLSLFSGPFWADTEKLYQSETDRLLATLPPTSGNLKRIEDAVKRDLAWVGEPLAVSVRMPALNRIEITINQTIIKTSWGLD